MGEHGEAGAGNPTRPRYYVTLGIHSTSESPDRIAARLGVAPDDSVVKGSKLPSGRSAPQHGWFLSTMDEKVDGTCDDHIAWLLGRVRRVDELADLSRGGNEVCFSIF